MFICLVCQFQTENLNSLRIHSAKKHGISSEALYLSTFLNGIKPTCECGCGQETKFNGLINGYSKLVQGHYSRINNNWGHNKDALSKSLNTRKKMWENGEIQGWCKGLTKEDPRVAALIQKMNTPERAKKISESLSGKAKSEHHKAQISKHMKSYWSEETNRERQSLGQAERIKNGLLTKCTRVHGYLDNVRKATNNKVYYRSLFEFNAFQYLESTDLVRSYTVEPYKIQYKIDGKIRNYVIDCLIEFQDGTKTLVEIKPNCHLKHEKNVAKFKSAEEFARNAGFTFEVWTEKTHEFLSKEISK